MTACACTFVCVHVLSWPHVTQVPFAESIRKEGGVATGAVGLVTTAAQVCVAAVFLVKMPGMHHRGADGQGCCWGYPLPPAHHHAPLATMGNVLLPGSTCRWARLHQALPCPCPCHRGLACLLL